MDIKEILLEEKNMLEQEFEENVENYFSVENIISEEKNEDFRICAISAQLTATWLRNSIPKIESYSEFCEKIESLRKLLEDKRYILAASISEIAYISFSLSLQDKIEEDIIQLLTELDKRKMYFTKNRMKAIIEDKSKLRSSLKGVSSEAALDASRIIIKLKQDSEFKRLEESSGYKIDPRYCKKSTHKTDNLNEQLNH